MHVLVLPAGCAFLPLGLHNILSSALSSAHGDSVTCLGAFAPQHYSDSPDSTTFSHT